MYDKKVSSAYRRFSEEARMLSESAKSNSVKKPEVVNGTLSSDTKKHQLIYDRELREAMELGEEFSGNRTDDGYMIKEGWDIYHVMHALVVLYHTLKGCINSGEIELVPQTKDEKTSDQP